MVVQDAAQQRHSGVVAHQQQRLCGGDLVEDLPLGQRQLQQRDGVAITDMSERFQRPDAQRRIELPRGFSQNRDRPRIARRGEER
jgi:hypothetical protein